jgi:hypothetical protein
MYFKLSRVDSVAISIHHGLGPKNYSGVERKVIVSRYVWNHNYNNYLWQVIFNALPHHKNNIYIHLEMLIVIKVDLSVNIDNWCVVVWGYFRCHFRWNIQGNTLALVTAKVLKRLSLMAMQNAEIFVEFFSEPRLLYLSAIETIRY